jgi:hypothetical protein
VFDFWTRRNADAPSHVVTRVRTRALSFRLAMVYHMSSSACSAAKLETACMPTTRRMTFSCDAYEARRVTCHGRLPGAAA